MGKRTRIILAGALVALAALVAAAGGYVAYCWVHYGQDIPPPHGANLSSHRSVVRIPLDPEPSLAVVPHPVTGFQRLLVARPPRVLEVASGEGTWHFLVPQPNTTLRRVREVLARREARPPQAEDGP